MAPVRTERMQAAEIRQDDGLDRAAVETNPGASEVDPDVEKTNPGAGKTELDAEKTKLKAGKTKLNAGKMDPAAEETNKDAGKKNPAAVSVHSAGRQKADGLDQALQTTPLHTADHAARKNQADGPEPWRRTERAQPVELKRKTERSLCIGMEPDCNGQTRAEEL